MKRKLLKTMMKYFTIISAILFWISFSTMFLPFAKFFGWVGLVGLVFSMFLSPLISMILFPIFLIVSISYVLAKKKAL